MVCFSSGSEVDVEEEDASSFSGSSSAKRRGRALLGATCIDVMVLALLAEFCDMNVFCLFTGSSSLSSTSALDLHHISDRM